ncbi:terminase large subunit domain-containing protein [Rhodococcus sp. NM-2]|uniref:terminase large subunit domain-containing protein n=1 Tax=Rhodococcus sp. NM-2 TaxID=3401174 RepID=UPI003AAB8829
MTTAASTTVTDFAARLLEEPLWPHQIEFAESPARYRSTASGRQVGKSRLLAVCALHEAYTKRNALVLVVSAGEEASKRLLADCAAMANAAPLLKGSVMSDTTNSIVLSNGSRILSVPASDKQIRGWSVDLLIVDEAGFISPEIWEAAEPAIVARPGSRVILSSSPWGSKDHFFRQMWQRGMTGADPDVAAWHWPSSVSPLADKALIERWRETWPAHKFAREIMAEWTDESGAYFTSDELDNAKAAYTYTSDDSDLTKLRPRHQLTAGGIDWGFKHDANCLVLLGVLDDASENRHHDANPVFYVPHLEAHYNTNSDVFIGRIVDVATEYDILQLVSEENGIGQFATESLRQAIRRERHRMQHNTRVSGVATTQQRKMNGFGAIKVLLQQGRLVLPEHPDLLRQLNALEYENTDSGLMSIAVPDNLGHDDYAMSLMQAVSTVNIHARAHRQEQWLGNRSDQGELLTTGNGTTIRQNPRTWNLPAALRSKRQSKDTEQW